MRVLLIKTSSLGDVIHTLPAVTDATRAIPGIRFDWVVEESFAEIPAWHPAVDRVIPVALRRWRKSVLRSWLSGEWRQMTQQLTAARYDLTIDAQGLIKSAILCRYATVPVHGFNRDCAREPLAGRFYTDPHPVAKGRHAVARLRELFARSLGYPVPADDASGDYGLDRDRVLAGADAGNDVKSGVLFLHGTTWTTKHWPERYWRELAQRCTDAGVAVRLPWGNDGERERAERIAAGIPLATVLPKLPLAGIAAELANARACVAVDTGLGHLAAALDVPTISLFGATHPGLTGAWGAQQTHLASDFPCAPCLKKQCAYTPTESDRERFDLVAEQPLCFTRLSPERVWERLTGMLQS
ncbi:lipopolysaccharide heptosyltransferase I [Azoarcus taiwanensis]|uniref:Lipopolysaccharide heptosyltransferase 1 n=1 Tax=Azoarcus taiwanensis TaxID=666964 RepID=A0A972JAH2_9RHOO|nr:lipopolysaccharide heptosyltransferase I [Azoarcus taiwanensis]NMG03083.1 lipopolysaccharide heptosyltransferase I [Azoarcus taiwanensis]